MVRDPGYISNLLQQQYAHVEAYCNAQIRLYNCSISDSVGESGVGTVRLDQLHISPTSMTMSEQKQAVAELFDAISLVRNDLKTLVDLANNNSSGNGHDVLPDTRICNSDLLRAHVDLSRRVIQTIRNNPSWHANGIPATSVDMKTNMVALASLKASIARVCDSIGQ